MDSDNKQGQDYNRRQEDLPERPKRRRLRWGRVFLLLIFLAVLLTTVFWGAVWIYSNVIHAPETKTVAADDKISKDEALNKRINVPVSYTHLSALGRRLVSVPRNCMPEAPWPYPN